MRRALLALSVVAICGAAAPVAGGAAASLPLGRYAGETGDGHVFELTVERSRRPHHPRKVTHFWLVYDIAGCRSGPIRQPFFASVYYGPVASRRGMFARDIALGAATPGRPQLSLKGRFSPGGTVVSGTFRVGVSGRCPIGPGTPSLTFKARRTR